MTPPVIQTDRLVLRPIGPQDFEPFAAFLASPRARFLGGPKSPAEAWRALATIVGHWTLRGFGNFAVTLRGETRCIGSMGPWYPEGWPERELAWSLWSEAAEGRGYAFEAMTRLRAWAYDTLGWTTAVSYIDRQNARSRALAERLGCSHDPDAAAPDSVHPIVVYRHPAPSGGAR